MERDLISWLNSQSNSDSKGLLLAPLKEDISPAEIVAHETAGELHDLREAVRELMTASGNGEGDSESLQGEGDNDIESVNESETLTQDNGILSEAISPAQDITDSQPANDIPAQDSYPMQDSYTSENVQASQLSDIVQDSNVQDDAQAPHVLDLTRDPYTQHDVQISDITQDSYAQDDAQAPHVSDLTRDSYSQHDVQISDITQDSYAHDNAQAPQLSDTTQDSNTQDDPANQTHTWQEQATGFTLSLDEPPPELWTHINDDDEDLDYEPTDSLQGAAYVQIHGRNFTERLQHTLKHRQERAHERAEAERELNPNRSYIQKTIIICATMLMVLGFAWLSLWFIRRETPEGMNIRAQSLADNAEYEQAASMYQKAYRRYPHELTFLAGLAENAEKSGHVQTAKTAWEEYIRVIPPENSRDITHAKEQLKLLGGDITEHKHERLQPTTPENLPPVKKPETITPSKPAPQKSPERFTLKEIPLSFEFYISEGNYAYNIGMFNRATVNFFKAMEIDSNDIRPYIGLANCYYEKGMYFDSKRILDEARKKFNRDPTIEMGYKILKEAK